MVKNLFLGDKRYICNSGVKLLVWICSCIHTTPQQMRSEKTILIPANVLCFYWLVCRFRAHSLFKVQYLYTFQQLSTTLGNLTAWGSSYKFLKHHWLIMCHQINVGLVTTDESSPDDLSPSWSFRSSNITLLLTILESSPCIWSPSSLPFYLSQHYRLFEWSTGRSLYDVCRIWSFEPDHLCYKEEFWVDLLVSLAIQGILRSLFQHQSSKTWQDPSALFNLWNSKFYLTRFICSR